MYTVYTSILIHELYPWTRIYFNMSITFKSNTVLQNVVDYSQHDAFNVIMKIRL